jgi:hypothetical protein
MIKLFRSIFQDAGDPCAINADCVFEGGVCNSDKVCENISGGGSIANLKYGEVARGIYSLLSLNDVVNLMNHFFNFSAFY